ncbi:hypothetical protein Tco_0783214 [Tanacetum coccineum]
MGFQLQTPRRTRIPAKVLEPKRCLDILNAWNRVWGTKHNDVGEVNVNEDTQSPTSTLSTTGNEESSTNLIELVGGNSSGSCDDGATGEECEEEWGYKDENRTESSIQGFNGISMASIDNNNNNGNGHMPSGNFLESFTDLLLSNSGSSNNRNSQGGGLQKTMAGNRMSFYKEQWKTEEDVAEIELHQTTSHDVFFSSEVFFVTSSSINYHLIHAYLRMKQFGSDLRMPDQIKGYQTRHGCKHAAMLPCQDSGQFQPSQSDNSLWLQSIHSKVADMSSVEEAYLAVVHVYKCVESGLTPLPRAHNKAHLSNY